jgi:hypothetical protein
MCKNYITGLILTHYKSEIIITGVKILNYQEIIVSLLLTKLSVNPQLIFLILLFI